MAYEKGRQMHSRDSLAEIAKNTRRTTEVLVGSGTFSGAGVATESTLSTIATEATLSSVDQNTTRDAWTTIPGNSLAIAYYTGTGGGSNPSGNTDNIETLTYSDSGGVVYTQTFAYDSTDRIISITAS
jgi:hypothetical protein